MLNIYSLREAKKYLKLLGLNINILDLNSLKIQFYEAENKLKFYETAIWNKLFILKLLEIKIKA